MPSPPSSMPSDQSPTEEPKEPVYHPTDFLELTEEVGRGDGVTWVYSAWLSKPIVPGTVVVMVTSDSAIDLLGNVVRGTQQIACGAHDITADGNLYGHVKAAQIDYALGRLTIEFLEPPPLGYHVVARWKRYQHINHAAALEIVMPSGERKTISLETLSHMLSLL